MKRPYQFCPFCGKKLSRNKQGYLSCPCGFIHYNNSKPTASMVIYNDKKEILLGKRSIEPFKNWWTLPGGFLEPNEHPLSGVKREIKEEVGLDIKPEKLLGIHMDSYNDPIQGHYYTLNLSYLGRYNNKKVIASDDVKEAKFFPIDKLPKICFKCDRQAVKEAIKLLRETKK